MREQKKEVVRYIGIGGIVAALPPQPNYGRPFTLGSDFPIQMCFRFTVLPLFSHIQKVSGTEGYSGSPPS